MLAAPCGCCWRQWSHTDLDGIGTLAKKVSGGNHIIVGRVLDDIGVVFKVDDEIEITGSKVKQEGVDLTLAREVVKGGETLTLRFKDGKPAW